MGYVDPGNWQGNRYADEEEGRQAQWQSFCEAKGIDSKAFGNVDELIMFVEDQCLAEYAETEHWQQLRKLIESDARYYTE